MEGLGGTPLVCQWSRTSWLQTSPESWVVCLHKNIMGMSYLHYHIYLCICISTTKCPFPSFFGYFCWILSVSELLILWLNQSSQQNHLDETNPITVYGLLWGVMDVY
jgi:hypothetical protein